jgi:hypothetical protein
MKDNVLQSCLLQPPAWTLSFFYFEAKKHACLSEHTEKLLRIKLLGRILIFFKLPFNTSRE